MVDDMGCHTAEPYALEVVADGGNRATRQLKYGYALHAHFNLMTIRLKDLGMVTVKPFAVWPDFRETSSTQI